MVIGVLFCVLAVLGGLAIARVLRTPISLAPLTGLAAMAVVTTFTAWLHLPPAAGTALVVSAALAGAPRAIFSLGLALGLEPLVSATGAVILALTWTYPYDYHLWSGWPQGMGVLLVSGLFATALHWLERPSVRLAALAGLFAGAILLSHGTEAYTAVLGLVVIALARIRRISPGPLARHLGVTVGVALVISLPYLPTLVGWAHGGGATSAAQEIVDYTAANSTLDAHADWLQYALGAFGAGSLVDLPL